MLKELQRRLKDIPEIGVAGGLAGFNVISFSNKSNVGTMFIHLKDWDERKGKEHSQDAVMQKIYQKTADIKNANILVIAPPSVPGLGRTSGFTFELAADNQHRQHTTVF